MKLCFNSIAYKKTEATAETILREIAELGDYQAVELLQLHFENLSRAEAKDLAGLAGELGLELPILSGYLGVLPLDMKGLADNLKLCRKLTSVADWMGVGMQRAFAGYLCEVTSLDPDPDYYKHVVQGFREICRVLQDSGQALATEVHRGTFTDTADGALKFLEDVGAENHYLLFQLGEVPSNSGMDGVKLYRALEKDVVHMHMHPYPWLEHRDNPDNLAGLLPVIDEEEPDFYVSIENCEADQPPLKAARDGAALVKKILQEAEDL